MRVELCIAALCVAGLALDAALAHLPTQEPAPPQPPLADELVRLLADAQEAARKAGEGFEAGIEAAVRRMLVDPLFLFRVETDPAPAPKAASLSRS